MPGANSVPSGRFPEGFLFRFFRHPAPVGGTIIVTLALRKRNRLFSLHGVPMTRWFQLDASPSRRFLSALVFGVLVCAGSVVGLQAQTAGESSTEVAPPAIATPTTPTFVPRFGSAAPFGDASGLSAPTSGYSAISPFKPTFDPGRDMGSSALPGKTPPIQIRLRRFLPEDAGNLLRASSLLMGDRPTRSIE